MTAPIVSSDKLIALVGGAEIAPEVLNILQTLTDTFVAADGGANTMDAAGLYPTKVIGDFDSLSDASRQKFAPQLLHIAEQDSTDLEKVITRVAAPVIVAAGFLGGRLDHTLAALNVLVRFPEVPLILLDHVDCCFCCRAGGMTLQVPPDIPLSVLPMDQIVATTQGLVWDMDRMPLHPAGMVSSSNRSAAEVVSINVTGPAIVTLPADHLSAAIAAVRAG